MKTRLRLRQWRAYLVTRIGALPARQFTWSLVALFSVWVVLDVMVFKFTTGIANSSYDAMVRARFYAAAPDPRLVVIDIDEASLAAMGKEFGRWPWPRDTLATLLEFVEQQKPAAIVWDVLFSDADRMSPGGDAAFNAAAAKSLHSHFPVVRLPVANDGSSQITRAVLPGLWAQNVGTPTAAPNSGALSAVALIAPALPALEKGRLGFNNGYVDKDGVLRRYRHFETLPDGSSLQSIVMSVAGALDSEAFARQLKRVDTRTDPKDALIAWRQHKDAYPHVSFAKVFAAAEGQKPAPDIPSFAGKIIIIGSTAPSLHDIHPTPISSVGAGVDSLATALDNALNQRYLLELPRWVQALVAILLCIGLGLWVQFRSVSSLAPALFILPIALVSMSYLSLNGLGVFLDLHVAAALVLVLLGVLRGWCTMRRNHWCSPPPYSDELQAIWVWQRRQPWLDDALDRLIDSVERLAPNCRIVVCDTTVSWPNALRWPELARFAAIVGPHSEMLAVRSRLEPTLMRLAFRHSEPVLVVGKTPGDASPYRELLARQVFQAWANLHKLQVEPQGTTHGDQTRVESATSGKE